MRARNKETDEPEGAGSDIPPERIGLDLRELPAPTRALLKDAQLGGDMVIPQEFLIGPVLTAVFSGIWCGLVALISGGKSISPKGMVVLPVLGILGSLPLIWAILTFIYRATTLKAFYFIHPAYIFDCHPDRIIAMPMCHVMGVEVMHVMTPFGSHKHSFITVKLRTGKSFEMVSRDGLDMAKKQANAIMSHSSRARSLAEQNKMSQIEGLDLVDWRLKGPGLRKPPIFLVSLALSLVIGAIHYFRLTN